MASLICSMLLSNTPRANSLFVCRSNDMCGAKCDIQKDFIKVSSLTFPPATPMNLIHSKMQCMSD